MIQQPTLAHVPGILASSLLRLIARIVLGIAGILLLLGLGLALASLWLATFRSTRTNRVQSLVDVTLAITELVKSYR